MLGQFVSIGGESASSSRDALTAGLGYLDAQELKFHWNSPTDPISKSQKVPTIAGAKKVVAILGNHRIIKGGDQDFRSFRLEVTIRDVSGTLWCDVLLHVQTEASEQGLGDVQIFILYFG